QERCCAPQPTTALPAGQDTDRPLCHLGPFFIPRRGAAGSGAGPPAPPELRRRNGLSRLVQADVQLLRALGAEAARLGLALCRLARGLHSLSLEFLDRAVGQLAQFLLGQATLGRLRLALDQQGSERRRGD